LAGIVTMAAPPGTGIDCAGICIAEAGKLDAKPTPASSGAG
jgi:hypothetical protein